jgi:tetratricopeptide (TPR) repeat protein
MGIGPNAAIQEAKRYSDHLSSRIKLILRAFQALDRGERFEALRSANELAASYPDDPEAALVAADIYFHYGDLAPRLMIKAFDQAIALDPRTPESYFHLVQVYSAIGDTANVWRAHAREVEVVRDGLAPWFRDIALRALFRHEDPLSLVNELTARLAERPPSNQAIALQSIMRQIIICGEADPPHALIVADSFAALAGKMERPTVLRLAALIYRHDLYLARGQYQKAWASLEQGMALDPTHIDILARTVLHYIIAGTREREARQAADRLMLQPDLLHMILLAVWYRAADGRLDSVETRSLYEHTVLMRADWVPYRDAFLAGLRGLNQISAGELGRGRELLSQAFEVQFPNTFVSWAVPDRRFTLALARLDLAAGELDVANHHVRDIKGWIGVLERAEAEELRGQIEEQLGDTAAAVQAYRNFVGMWQDADPELQPRVAAARAALARLEGH